MLDLQTFDHQTAPPSPQSTTAPTQQKDISFLLPSTTKDGQPRRRKLRASCDSCSMAKVRCGKEHPTCQRCINHGRTCHYSPSMRLGKPPSKHKKLKAEKERNNSTSSTASPSASLTSSLDSISKVDSVLGSTASMDKLSDMSLYSLDSHHSLGDDLMALGGGFSPKSDNPPTLDNLMHDAMYFSEPFSHDLNLSDSDEFNMDFQTGLSVDGTDSCNSVDLKTGDDLASCFNGTYGLQGLEFSGGALPTPITPAESPKRQSHDCTELAFSTLNSLYSCENLHSRPGAFDNVTLAVDDIISENEKAMKHVDQLLACPCTVSPHFSTSLCFILLKILSLYQTAARQSQDYPADESLARQIPSPSSSIGREFDSPHNKTQTQSVIAGLRRVEKVVDDFSLRFSRDTVTGKSINEMVFVHLERMLRSMLRKAVASAVNGSGSNADF